LELIVIVYVNETSYRVLAEGDGAANVAVRGVKGLIVKSYEKP
jgi:hypothetical protein